MYNNSNESESGINGYKRDTTERGNRIYEEQKQQKNREYTWEEYNKWEQSIKPIETNQLTKNEKESINKAKSEYNKDVVLYDANNNDNTYSGGASQQTKNKITISRQSAEEFGLNKMIDHENVESDILHNDSARDILSPAIKVFTRKVDKNEGKLNKRNDYARGKARYSLPYSESNGNQGTTRNYDEISNINTKRTSKRIGSVASGTDNIRNSIENPNKMSFSMDNQLSKKMWRKYFINKKEEKISSKFINIISSYIQTKLLLYN